MLSSLLTFARNLAKTVNWIQEYVGCFLNCYNVKTLRGNFHNQQSLKKPKHLEHALRLKVK